MDHKILKIMYYNHGQNILELCNISEKIGFTTSKVVADI